MGKTINSRKTGLIDTDDEDKPQVEVVVILNGITDLPYRMRMHAGQDFTFSLLVEGTAISLFVIRCDRIIRRGKKRAHLVVTEDGDTKTHVLSPYESVEWAIPLL